MYTWTSFDCIFGWQYASLSDIFFTFIIQLPLPLIFPLEKIPDIVMLSVFTLSGVTWYYFGRYLRLSILSSYILGLFVISSPVFFNFIIFGWIYSFIFIICLPFMIIFYLNFLETGRFIYIILQGIVFSFALAEAQSPAWILIIYFSILLTRINIKNTFKTILFIISFVSISFLIHSMWIFPLFTNDAAIINAGASKFDILRHNLKMNSINFIRSWGSTYNSQYEVAYNTLMPISLSLIYPILAFSLLLFKDLKREKLLLSFALVFLFIYFFWYFSFYLSYIPFSNMIRNVARCLLLTSISLSFFFSLWVEKTLNYLRTKDNANLIYGFYLFLFFVYMCNGYPFLRGEIYSNASKNKSTGISVHGFDQRIRKWKMPDYYKELEKHTLFTLQDNYKTLVLPSGALFCLDMSQNKFAENWTGLVDYTKYSITCNLITVTDKSQESSLKFIQRLLDNFYKNNTHRCYTLTNIKYLVLRKNIVGSHYNHYLIYPKEFSNNLRNTKSISLVNNNKNYMIYENKQAKPLIYGKNF